MRRRSLVAAAAAGDEALGDTEQKKIIRIMHKVDYDTFGRVMNGNPSLHMWSMDIVLARCCDEEEYVYVRFYDADT